MGDNSDFGLLFYAAFHHPDIQLRIHIQAEIRNYVAKTPYRDAEDQLNTLLHRYPGTDLEPFVLQKETLDIAVLMLLFAFANGATRFRVVSQETLGNKGGLVVTRKIKSFYQERYAHSKKGVQREDVGAFFAPALMQKFEPSTPECAPKVYCCADDSGYHLILNGLKWSGHVTQETLAHLQANSSVMASGQKLDRLGLQFSYSGHRLYLKPTGPESLLQFSALISQNAVLCFEFQEQRVFLGLIDSELDRVELSAIHTQPYQITNEWVGIPFDHGFSLTDDVCIAISEWILPHDSWVTPSFLKAHL